MKSKLVFNDGKYRSIYTSKQNELEKIRRNVLTDKDHLPSFHIYPKTGLLNDPNGLVFDGENYHIFYQWYPFDAIHGMKHWAHLITKDFINFQEIEPIVPDTKFESHGCYSGGAISLDEKLYCFYTGNTRLPENFERKSFQNIAILDKSSNEVLDKVNIISNTPEGYTEHFRDPKPWILDDGNIRFICGAQRNNETGTVVVFDMDKDDLNYKIVGELSLKGFDKSFDESNVFMWECPNLLKIEDKDIFIGCPQGLQPSKERYNNIYSVVYGVGNLENLDFDIEYYDELDKGFDFYAPQIFSNVEETIMYGWVGVPTLEYPTDKYKWHSALTLPRKLEVKNGKIYQKPIKAVYESLLANIKQQVIEGKTELDMNLAKSYIKFDSKNEEFTLNLFDDGKNRITLEYRDTFFKIDRSNTIQTDTMIKYGETRSVKIDKLDEIEIFIDNSIIEIYLNNGEHVLTSRFFIENKQNVIITNKPINILIQNVGGIKLWEK